MSLENELKKYTKQALSSLYNYNPNDDKILFQATRKEFAGDLTLVVFPLVKELKKAPDVLANEIGTYLKENISEIVDFNIIKGFLNISIHSTFWINSFNTVLENKNYGLLSPSGKTYMVEYSSPNTNKPLHLGHLRNNFLGYSVSEILKANGHKVVKTQIINDRGIHICKSMLAWKKFGEGETPVSSGLKGDKLVGKYYVIFDQKYKEEINALIEAGKTEEEAKKTAPLMIEAQEMLLKWEQKEPEVYSLWQTMNGWVYEGFDATYKRLGVNFDELYYESDTYLLGKEVVEEGLEKGVFFKKDDGSVWCDLTADGLDEKLVLRADGTSVYMTQDIGTAIERVKNHPTLNGMIYTVGNEQDYHFKVLFLILKKMGYSWAEELYHLSYGMVDLPTGKMKSREGTVVDADDLMADMVNTAEKQSEELGKLDDADNVEKKELFETIGLGALKYFLLKVDPKKRMMFNPEESIDLQGNTGPFIQYAYARIQSVLRKAKFDKNDISLAKVDSNNSLIELEQELIKKVLAYTDVLKEAGKGLSPALIANYTYDLVKTYNSFYQSVSILKEENEALKNMRVSLSYLTGTVIKKSMLLLGVNVPNRM